MSEYVPPIEQLVTEIVVRDIKRSTDFYRRLGFELLRDGGDFVERLCPIGLHGIGGWF